MGAQSSSTISPDHSPDLIDERSSPSRKSLFSRTSQCTLDDTVTINAKDWTHRDNPTVHFTEDERMISKTLCGLFFSDKDDLEDIRLSISMQSLRIEHAKRGSLLMTQGEVGDRLYIISSGEVDVLMDGELIRRVGRGALIGELALLYEYPRSASIRCCSNCKLWRLDKASFEEIMRFASPNSVAQRGRWLSNVPELNELGSIGLSVLVSSLDSSRLNCGGSLYVESELTERCIMIESGTAVIELPTDMVGLSRDEIDLRLGIFRPRGGRQKDWRDVSLPHLISYLSSAYTVFASPASIVEAQPDPEPLGDQQDLHYVHEGCILGLGILFNAAGIQKTGQSVKWRWDKSETPRTDRSSKMARRRSRTSSFAAEDEASAPYSCFVTSPQLMYSFFTVTSFRESFGSLNTLLSKLVRRSARIDSIRNSNPEGRFLIDLIRMKEMEHKVQIRKMRTGHDDDFDILAILATGSKSTILLASKKAEFGRDEFALKVMSKDKILADGKFRHTVDECKLLGACCSPFISSFYGCYQAADFVVLCMEPVYQNDLYTVIRAPAKTKGLPLDMVRFYAASVILAMAHMHSRGIAYRGLRSENVMIDERGYVKLIDFAFAKQIPYLSCDMTGLVKMNGKSFTMCGAAEYLAPEYVFNTGANHAADIWALGILTHEMHTQMSPFAMKKDMSDMKILESIAACKNSGVAISSSWDLIGGSNWKNFIVQLLKADMSKRLGVTEKDTLCLLHHCFFNTFEKDALVLLNHEAPFIPNRRVLPYSKSFQSSLDQVKDNSVFEVFNKVGASD